MVDTKKTFLEIIGKEYPIVQEDAGEFSAFDMNGMNFTVEKYKAEGLGFVSWMRAEGMVGAMKMDTVVVNAFNVDMPMFSYDRIYAMGKETIIVEIYNTLLGEYDSKGFKEAHDLLNSYPDMPANGEHWYDAIRYPESIAKVGEDKDSELFDKALYGFIGEFIKEAKSAPACDVNAKIDKASEYPTNLVEQGGFAADNFIKAIGKEKTREFFKTVLFNA